MLTYVIGPPGVGKSTLVEALLEGWSPTPEKLGILGLTRWTRSSGEVVEIGLHRARFSGTDALSMGVMPVACEWIKRRPEEHVVGEGDRLASMRFLGAAAEGGYDPVLVVLDCPDYLLDARRRARGSQQNEQWLRGRATKVSRLAEAWAAEGGRVERFDARATPNALAAEVVLRGAWPTPDR